MTAYQVLTTYFRDVEPYWRLRPGGSDPANGAGVDLHCLLPAQHR